MVTPHGAPTRGVSPYSDRLISALRSVGASVDVLDYRALYPVSLLPSGGAAGTDSPAAVLHWASPLSWRKAAALAGRVVHIQHWTSVMAPMLLGLVRALDSQGKRVVMTVHNPAPHEAMPLFPVLEARLFRRADALIVHDERGVERLLAQWPDLDRTRIHVIPHGLACHYSTGHESKDYQYLGLSPDRRYVITFGNLRGYKGLPALLEAWVSVAEGIRDVDLVIAGRFWGGGRRPLARMASRWLGADRAEARVRDALDHPLIRDRVILREGFVPDEYIDACCRVATLGVFAYERFAGQSGAATRAAGWGVPLVVSDTGALADLTGDPRQVVPPGDAAALALTLRCILADPARLSRWKERQCTRIRDYEWPAVARQHLALYRRLGER